MNYACQEKEDGIAAALLLAEHFAEGEPVCVVVEDNLFEKGIKEAVGGFTGGARLLLQEVPNPEHLGAPELTGERVMRINEKPLEPPSPHVVAGVHVYDGRVFDIIKTLGTSAWGKLEITHANDRYYIG